MQEHQQGKHLPLPKYNVLALTGPTNEQIFKVEVRIQDAEPQVAEGASRRAAEQAAAMQLLTQLGISEEEK